LLDLSGLATTEAQIVVVRAYLERLTAATRIVLCSGNHDLDQEEDGERVASWIATSDGLPLCRDGQHIVVDGVLVSALPWWDGPRSRAAVARQIECDGATRQGPWIWAHHAPPADSGLSWGGVRHYGDRDLLALIDRHRPDFVFSGHVHQAPFVSGGTWAERIGSSWCFNMGQQLGPVPAHIALNLDRSEAVWLSQAGPERLSLSPGSRPEPIKELPDWF
jgi:hypothetical protein